MSNEDKIGALIGQTKDPVQQATLLILSKIDAALEANTKATERIASGVETVDKKLEKHVNDEEKLLASIRGGQTVALFFMGALLLLAGYIVKQHFDRNDAQDTALSTIREDVVVVKKQVETNTKRIDVLEGVHRESGNNNHRR